MSSYTVGSTLRATFTFRTADGTAGDPSTVRLRYRQPEGGVREFLYAADAEVVKSATGVYYLDIPLTAPGTWRVGAKGTGPVETNSPDFTFNVDSAPAAPA